MWEPGTIFPHRLGILDHYTLIVADARKAAEFHVELLGFKPLRIQEVNTGTAPAGQADMLNHILELPAQPGRVCVITEGLTEESVFRRYLNRYGGGLHHVAYQVDHLEATYQEMRRRGVRFTSDEIQHDALTGLRQVFISREHGGYFIELIERSDEAADGHFASHNMACLADTMEGYLDAGGVEQGEAPPGECRISIQTTREKIARFLASPGNLPLWTCHRTVRWIDGQWKEIRLHGDVPLDVVPSPAGDQVSFRWRQGAVERVVRFSLEARRDGCDVSVTLPPASLAQRRQLEALLGAELRVLKAFLEDRRVDIRPADLELINKAHLEVYQRKGL